LDRDFINKSTLDIILVFGSLILFFISFPLY
jgi:hypothetical protein